MTDKEFRHMRRGDLIQIIYQYQQEVQSLRKQVESLTAQLAERRIKIENAGSIAEAALALNQVIESAQAAADQYLEEIRIANSGAVTQANDLSAAEKREAADVVS